MKRLIAILVSAGVAVVDSMHGRVYRLFKRSLPPRGVILYYHAVHPRDRAAFAWQMDEAQKRAHVFTAGSPEAILPGSRNVAITFDDGFRSVAENAIPELTQRGIPFTLFVPSGYLGGRPGWVRRPDHSLANERILSGEELRALAKGPLTTIGSHSVTHPHFLRIDADHARRELIQSKGDLEKAAGVTIDLFSFPHGAYSAALVQEAQGAGYRRVFTIESTTIGSDPNVFVVGRVAADPTDWRIEFRLKLAGAYRWRPYLHSLRATLNPTT